MKLTDFYNEVTRKTDTSKTQINAAETKRVLSVAFDMLSKMDAAEMSDTIAKGLAVDKKKRATNTNPKITQRASSCAFLSYPSY